MKSVFTVLGASVILASCITINERTSEQGEAPAKQTPQVRGALSGKKQLIASFYATAPDCSSLGYPTLKLAKPPLRGQVSVEHGTEFARFGKNDPRNSCNGMQVPATTIYYTSDPGFIGPDSVAFDRIGVAGAYGYHAYTINVR